MVRTEISKAKSTQANGEERGAWRMHADSLANWVLGRMVNRDDAHGRYYIKEDGEARSCKVDNAVDYGLLHRHFAADQIIGLYSTSRDDKCRWLTVDIDRHDGESDEIAAVNERFAFDLYDGLIEKGFTPLLLDSNGKGGRHLTVLFSETAAARDVRAFGLWLVREWEAFGLASRPEVFPKQDSIKGGYGNFVRLFGKHYKRPFYTKVWDGESWLSGEASITWILAKAGDSPRLIPAEAVISPPSQVTPAQRRPWWKAYRCDLRRLEVAGLFESFGLWVIDSGNGQYKVECPWASEHTSGDNSATVASADRERNLFPVFHCFHDHCEGRSMEDVLAHFGKAAVESYCRTPPRSGTPLNPSDPMGTARAFRSRQGKYLVHHLGTWRQWDSRRYQERPEADVRAELWKWLERESPSRPTRAVVNGSLDALKAVANLSSNVEMPAWLDRQDSSSPEDIVAFENGLLDLKAYQETKSPRLLPHTPQWFSDNCLPHRFDVEARCPHWLQFLNDVLDSDEERIQALAQWFGYNLTGDIRQHKVALFIGPPRSGKGTTMRVLTHMLGSVNVANPTFTSLSGRFGLAPLVGKLAALIGDGHLGRQSDAVAILERLKSISGGDPQNVDRKHASELANIVIKARFTIAVNELPRFPDSSAALRSRMLVIPFSKSFEGREDHELGDRLQAEIPGVTNWALAGLLELRRMGRLIQPKAGHEFLDSFTRLSSPVKAFLNDRCETGSDYSVLCDELRAAWVEWCGKNGHEPGSDSSFGAKLKAANPSIGRTRKRRGDGRQPYHYQGIRLTESGPSPVG